MRLSAALLMAWVLFAAERTVDPTFLRRFVPDLREKQTEATSPTCHYKPIFGAGDAQANLLKGISRFAEMRVDSGGTSRAIEYPREELAYVLLEGAGVLTYGEEKFPVRKHDFWYVPPGLKHALAGSSDGGCRAVVTGFKIPAGAKITVPPKLLLANIDEVKKQPVGGHPPSVLYQLLMGDTRSTRDRIGAGHVLTSLFIMEFAPGGTNFPHHHETEEEIYLLLDGRGDMVAGSGTDGVEGRYPAKPGDAYFFRLNCTVGFYSSNEPGAKSHILAVRSLFPFRQNFGVK